MMQIHMQNGGDTNWRLEFVVSSCCWTETTMSSVKDKMGVVYT